VVGDPHRIERVELKKLAILTGEIHAHHIATEGAIPEMRRAAPEGASYCPNRERERRNRLMECRSELGAAASTPDRHRLHLPLPWLRDKTGACW